MPSRDATALPISSALPALRDALRSRRTAVLQAPPGAGKTTRVPLALLDEPWLRDRRLVMLEPRRLAARAAAAHMARLLGEPVGATVGYRVRLDTRVGPGTRIEVVTEGILTRMLQDDPALEGTGLVIFDEFHERSIHADLGLALTLQSRELLRHDLAILVMSATLDAAPIADLLGGGRAGAAPVIRSEGRSFPVETRYIVRRAEQRIEAQVAAAVRASLARDDGDLLVFLPGIGEIRRTASILEEQALDPSLAIIPLHGMLPLSEQDRAIAPSSPGSRKVVLATSIAETSITIEGIRVVIDAGLMRVPRFSPRSGMTKLDTIRVSRASADQRRGRAGRLAPGICYRVWAEHEEGHLVAASAPEILEADLASLALTLAEAGVMEPRELAWLDAPPAAAFGQARELLGQLGAIDASGRIMEHGRRMARLAVHPRLAHMVLTAQRMGHIALACDLAALLVERDILRGEGGPPEVDLRLRLEALRSSRRGEAPATIHGATVDREALRRIREQARQFRAQTGSDAAGGRAERSRRRARAASAELADASYDIGMTGALLVLAYPDRIAQRRSEPGRFLLRNGRGAVLGSQQSLGDATWIVVADLDDARPESRIFLAAPVALDDVEGLLGDQIVRESLIEWDAEAKAVIARRRDRLGALILADAPLRDPDPDAVRDALLEGLARAGVRSLPWSDAARKLRARIAFLARHEPGWPDVSDEALGATLREWLAPHLTSVRRLAELERIDLAAVLLGVLGWRQRAALDEKAPTHWAVPSGSRIPIDYDDPESPVLAVRLQEMFGCVDTPRIAGGRVPLVLHLLSPAHRPVQVTRDLAGFWRRSYFDVRRDLRGRYPKHHWPDDPLAAAPTNRAKRRE